MGNQNREYRATHDEKNGVLRELTKLEDQWRQDNDREMQLAFDKRAEMVKTDPRMEGILKKYQAAVIAQREAEEEAKNLGAHICANGYGEDRQYYVQSNNVSDNDIRQEFNDKLNRRRMKLSEIRSRINLANLRSEVEALDKAARKL